MAKVLPAVPLKARLFVKVPPFRTRTELVLAVRVRRPAGP
jgi:hypothetical protein